MPAATTTANKTGSACHRHFSGPKDEYQDMAHIHVVNCDTGHIHTVISFLPPSTNVMEWSGLSGHMSWPIHLPEPCPDLSLVVCVGQKSC